MRLLCEQVLDTDDITEIKDMVQFFEIMDNVYEGTQNWSIKKGDGKRVFIRNYFESYLCFVELSFSYTQSEDGTLKRSKIIRDNIKFFYQDESDEFTFENIRDDLFCIKNSKEHYPHLCEHEKFVKTFNKDTGKWLNDN